MKLILIKKGRNYLNINDILPGDVLFVWGKSIIDDAIEYITNGPSHCAIFIDQDTLAEAQAGKPIGTGSFTDYLSAKERRLEVWRDETLNEDERKKIVEYAKSQFGLQYDYLAIVAELVRFEFNIPIPNYNEGKLRICSSYVNDCAKSVARNWANISYPPAPVDLLKGGKLTQKWVITN